ncbi:MAG: SpoIID/LytB domain-containing protein [Bacteroidales bacterium]|jgi:stage II sporulation protein D|nr:SpoIID/LytB domain-containing protein [Bacteroidales bacterium]
MKRIVALIIILCTLSSLSFGQKIRIRVFSDMNVDKAEIKALFGTYTLYFNDTIRVNMKRNARIEVANRNNKLRVSINDSLMGDYNKLKLASFGLKSFFALTPSDNEKLKRNYDDDLVVTPSGKALLLINEVAEDNYIAAVVQSETWGATTNVEFFKVQALCCRNYMMKNLNKHKKDGYNLCDCVHCQVYKSRANKPEVIEAVYKTNKEVICDTNGNIIETPFHSNSGGTTVAAVDVWGKDVPYLVSVEDTFSLASKNLNWEKQIRIREWLNYFRDKGIDIKDSANRIALLNFNQSTGRKKDIMGVSLVQIRKDFGLKSTFFNVQEWGSDVKLTGKGYGHGVGLSQEGAIIMCEQGFEYWEVIEHYFPSCRVMKESDLKSGL